MNHEEEIHELKERVRKLEQVLLTLLTIFHDIHEMNHIVREFKQEVEE